MRLLRLLSLLVVGSTFAFPAIAGELDTGTIPSPVILEPEGDALASVFLISDGDGWNQAEAATAEELRSQGTAVVGIDLPAYLLRLDSDNRACAYTVSAIESLNRQLHRRAGLKTYHLPVIAGAGAGGAMALAIAAQTPAATIGGTVALDPEADIALRKPLCTPAAKEKTARGMAYGLKPGVLPNPVTILSSPAGDPDGKEHANRLTSAHSDITTEAVDDREPATLAEAILARIEASRSAVDSLPLALVEAEAQHGLMSIIISGDGGWRDIDKKVAGFLAEDGVPTVGIDALRYYWSERSPAETARDMERIIDAYAPRFGAEKLLLIGYSFGANVLPSSYREMRPEYRRRVVMLSLLAPSRKADFEIAVTGWLGVDGAGKAGMTADHIRAGDPAKVQCLYGLSEKESACHDLAGAPATVLGLPGGHHFDGDYRTLTTRILEAALLRAGSHPQPAAD